VIPKAPRCCLYSCSVFPGKSFARKATLFSVRSRESMWCWAKSGGQTRQNGDEGGQVWDVHAIRRRPLRFC
jgi:hypothetical protein